MSDLNSTPSANRLHIGFFGVRNAGKSSVVNAVTGQDLAVVSDVLGTTTDPVLKAMELLPLGPVVIVDTPGFASLEFARDEQVLKEDLEDCFPEFGPYIARCRFHPSCAHMNDAGCAVTAAVEEGVIAGSRYRSYRAMYEEVKDLAAWQLKSPK